MDKGNKNIFGLFRQEGGVVLTEALNAEFTVFPGLQINRGRDLVRTKGERETE